MCPCSARVAARYQASFAEQFERADQLGQVDSALARIISQSGLLDGDANDDKIRVTKKPVSSVSLSPSQSTIDLNQVVGIALEMLYLGGGSGEDLGAMVSSDGYVLDGHHRWAASIIASGKGASVRVWRAALKGRDLIRVLNTITKGIYGIQKGNPGRGSIKNVTPAKVRAKLEEFLAHGRQSKKFSPSPELVREILVDNFGSAEEGIRVLSERANLVPKQIPSWAPSRDQMPAIKRKNAPGAAKILNQGVVDWAPPYWDEMQAGSGRVAARYRIRQAAYWAAAEIQRGPRTASSHEMTGDVLAAFGEAFYLTPYGKQAGLGSLRNLGKRLKQLGKLFTKAPRLWERFKRLVGIESLTDLPRALKDLAKRGFAALKKVAQRMFSTMPLKIYTIRGGLNDVLSQVMQRVPGLEKLLRRVKGKGDELGRWLKEKAPALSSVLIVAIFLFIWLNVVEFEWNLNDLTDALMGNIGLGDLLASLPGSAIGFLMNSLGFGVFTLLPATIVLRVLWLMHKGYLVWDGRRFDLDEVALQRDGFAIGAAR